MAVVVQWLFLPEVLEVQVDHPVHRNRHHNILRLARPSPPSSPSLLSLPSSPSAGTHTHTPRHLTSRQTHTDAWRVVSVELLCRYVTYLEGVDVKVGRET